MKNIFITLFLLGIISGFTLWNTLSVVSHLTRVEDALAAFPDPTEENQQEQQLALERLKEEWDKGHLLFHASFIRSGLRGSEDTLCQLEGAIQTKDPTEYKISLACLRHSLFSLRKTVLPSLSYIL
ncbi:MAG: hypothetical protein J6K61_02140 [Clostridia bacterium]|nr:hypothetical protein [Clostridia bacterium]